MGKAKKSQPGYSRRTISIPTKLDLRMSEYPEINWSAVAKVAFEERLSLEEIKKGTQIMQSVVARLKASKVRVQTEVFKDGFALGQTWAKETAEVDELQRLEDHDQRLSDIGRDWEWQFGPNPDLLCKKYEQLHTILSGLPQADEDAAKSLFIDSLSIEDSQLENSSFLQGFAEGALNIWRDVKDQI